MTETAKPTTAQRLSSKEPVPHPFERFRDREWDRDELTDRIEDDAWNREHYELGFESRGVGGEQSYW